MADVKISELTALTSANVDASGDVLAVVDTSATATRKITVENLLSPITINKATDVITDLGTVSGATSITSTAFVEEGGVLKENLLTNSGFDVWSNSTLENVGSDLVTNGGFGSDTSNWVAGDSTLASAGSGQSGNCLQITRTGANWQSATSVALSLTIGKLYKLTGYVKSGTSGDEAFTIGILNNAESAWLHQADGGTSSASWVQYSVVFEATETNSKVGLFKQTATAGTMFFDTVTCYEVTPGCVASNSLAMDGWWKDNDQDLWRQHNDGGTLTHDGSFYSLKVYATGGSGHEVLWPSSDLHTSETHCQRFAGRTVTFGCWMKSDAATIVKAADNGGITQDTHTGGNAWEWIEVTHTVTSSPTSFKVFFRSAGTDTYYISQPMLVFGSSIGEGNYTRPQGEVIFFESSQMSNEFANSTVGDTVEVKSTADSDGVVPKGVKAVYATLEGKAAANPGYQLYTSGTGIPNQQLEIANQVNGVNTTSQGWVSIESNGDFSMSEVTPFTGVYLYYTGVMLR